MFLLIDQFTIAFIAHAFVPVITAQYDLCAFRHDHAMIIEPGVDCCLAAAPTDRFDLRDTVRDLEQTFRAGEEECLEIRPQTEAEDRNIVPVGQAFHLIDLRIGQKLAFITDHHVIMPVLHAEFMIQFADLHILTDCQSLGVQPNAGARDGVDIALIIYNIIPRIDGRFDE